jgi:hypothetical protein
MDGHPDAKYCILKLHLPRSGLATVVNAVIISVKSERGGTATDKITPSNNIH